MGKSQDVKKSSENIMEYDSDFESPNLLKKSRPVKAIEVLVMEDGREDVIEDFGSPALKEDEQADVLKKQTSRSNSAKLAKVKKNAENRWGIEVSELTKSQSKRLKNQKQSKLDNFFNNKGKERKPKADQEMEEALKLSRQTFEIEQQQKIKGKDSKQGPKQSNVSKDDNNDVPTTNSPKYAYVNNPVRGKEERKKLKGFDCRDCEDYYNGKLEEGYTEEEVDKLINECSKHRAKYKAPLTPEKFWDPDIVVGDPESPRNKTQVPSQPLMSRARRRARNKEKLKLVQEKMRVEEEEKRNKMRMEEEENDMF